MRKPWLVYSVIFTVLSALFLWYQFQYIPSRKKALTTRYLRILATITRELKAELSGLVPPLTNTVTRVLDGQYPDTDKTKKTLEEELRKLRHVEAVQVTDLVSTGAPAATVALEIPESQEPPAWELKYVHQHCGMDYTVKMRLALETMINPMLKREEFDAFLIVDPGNKVIFQQGGSEITVVKLRSFGSNEVGTFQTNWVTGSGVDFILLGQPVRFSLPLSTQTLEWTLCGLARADNVKKRSSEISLTLLIGICSLTLLLMLLWPFFDVFAMSSSENLRGFDLFLLMFSMLLGVWVLAFVFMLFLGYQQLEHSLDRDLEAIAANISTNFATELRGAVTELNRLDELRSELSTKGTNVYINETNIYTNSIIFKDGPLGDRTRYPWFQMAFWVAATNGQQVAKWTRKDANTRLIDVKDRAYFQRIIKGRTWKTQTTDSMVEFTIEPIYSRNTGENMAVVATKARCGGVAAIDVNFLSLTDTLLPADFGFAVFDREGQVLFHSDERRNLRENFLVECEQHPRLLAAIRSRGHDSFDLKYAGEEHSVFVRPLEDLPWTIAVFRDERPLQSGNLVVGSIGLVFGGLALGGGLIVFVGCALCRWLRRYRHVVPRLGFVASQVCSWRWVWPNPYWKNGYAAALVVNLLLSTIVVVLARHACAGSHLPKFLIFVAVVAVPLNILILRWRATKEAMSWTCLSWWYVLSAGSLLFLISAVPGMVAFTCIFRNEVVLVAKRVQLDLAVKEADRRERFVARYSNLAGATNMADLHAMKHWGQYYATPATFGTWTSSWPEKRQTNCCESFSFDYPRIRTLYDRFANDTLVYLPTRTTDGIWKWFQPSVTNLILHVEGFGAMRKPGVMTRSIMSTIPLFPANWWWVLLGGGLSFLVCCLAVWFIAHHVFLLGVAARSGPRYVRAISPGECQRVWDDLPVTKNHRRILYRIARKGLVTHKCPEIGELFDKGLIVRDPELRVANEDFRNTILSSYDRAADAPTPANEPESAWHRARKPIIWILLLAGLYYFTTQRSIWDNSLALLTGFAGAITALLNVMKLFSEKARQPSPPPPAKTT